MYTWRLFHEIYYGRMTMRLPLFAMTRATRAMTPLPQVRSETRGQHVCLLFRKAPYFTIDISAEVCSLFRLLPFMSCNILLMVDNMDYK